MSLDYESARLEHAGGFQLRFQCQLRNLGRTPWQGDLGFQLFDPATGRFITEGEWRRVETAVPAGSAIPIDWTVTLPAEPGPYRVYLSGRDTDGWLYTRGSWMVAAAVTLSRESASVEQVEVTTLARLRRRAWPRAAAEALAGPFRTILRHRALIASMTRRDILARYRGSFAGAFWTILHPLLLMATYFFVFGVVLAPKVPDFPFYFLAGMLPWLAVSEAAGRGPSLVTDHRNFVKKLVFPIEILPVNAALAGLVTGIAATVLLAAALALARGSLPVSIAWLPAILIPQFALTLGIVWMLAAAGVFLRDLAQINGFALTAWFFLTPICYSESALPAALLPVLGKNPMFILVRAYRAILLEGRPPEWAALWKLWLLAFAALCLGYAFFRKLRNSFASTI